MNQDELYSWIDDVEKHCQAMEIMVNDRVILKQAITNHLSKYFDFDDIKFSNDFSVITLKWSYSKGLVINPQNLEGLGMEFTVSHKFDDMYGDGIVVELYPFGWEEIEE